MKALSVRQPWAWLILHGGKDIENREWGDRYPGLIDARKLVHQAHYDHGDRGWFMIHAGKGMTRAEYADAVGFVDAIDPECLITVPQFEDLPRGGVVGKAQLVNIVRESDSPWYFGEIGLVLKNPTPLPFKPLTGALGFFDVDYALEVA
jgi:hypothetical protein